MKILVASLHYVISDTSGSEFTRSFEYLKYIASDTSLSGDVIVGYSDISNIGNFRIHKLFSKKPKFITVTTRLKFIILVLLKSIQLLRLQKYDCIWHQCPFAIDETFSLLALWNKKKTRFIIGPIYTPHSVIKGANDYGYQRNDDGSVSSLSLWNRFNVIFYRRFSKIFKNLSLKTLQYASCVITIDKDGERMLKKRGIYHVKTIPISIPGDAFSKTPRRKKNARFTLLSVSYLVWRKRTVDLIDAVDILVKKYNIVNFKLIIVGDGPQKSFLEKLTQEYNLSKYILFKGYIPRTKVHKHYKNADIFISGSISDIMPGMYFEAMTASLPMVVTENNTALELKKNNFGGFVVERKRPDLIAEAINKIMKNKGLYARFSKRNYELMQTTYNFEKSMEELKRTFRD